MFKDEVFRYTVVPTHLNTIYISIKAAVMNDDIITAFDGNFLLDEGHRNL